MYFKVVILVIAFGLTNIASLAYAQGMEGKQSMTETTKGSAESNKKEGENFLKKNKANSKVTTLPSGLQYKVMNATTGAKPSATDEVVVEYVGKFIDGTEFDSSAKHGGPATFVVNQVIPGWVEALQLMPVGSTWEIYIPSELAYGERGAPPIIGPNKTLIFNVKLVDIKK